MGKTKTDPYNTHDTPELNSSRRIKYFIESFSLAVTFSLISPGMGVLGSISWNWHAQQMTRVNNFQSGEPVSGLSSWSTTHLGVETF